MIIIIIIVIINNNENKRATFPPNPPQRQRLATSCRWGKYRRWHLENYLCCKKLKFYLHVRDRFDKERVILNS